MSETMKEHYLSWVRDAHAMEKQAETMLNNLAARLEHYPVLKTDIEMHAEVTRQQQTLVQSVIDRHGESRSLLKDAAGKLVAFGQAMAGVMVDDEVVKGVISVYVFEQFEIANYTSLISAADQVNDTEGVRIFTRIREQEITMAERVMKHIPDITQQFLIRDVAPDVEAKR